MVSIPSVHSAREVSFKANSLKEVRVALVQAIYYAANGRQTYVDFDWHNMTAEDRRTIAQECRGEGYTVLEGVIYLRLSWAANGAANRASNGF